MAAHFFKLLNYTKAFKDAQNYHQYAIKNGDPATKQFHLQAHIKAVSQGSIPTGGMKSVPTNLDNGGGY